MRRLAEATGYEPRRTRRAAALAALALCACAATQPATTQPAASVAKQDGPEKSLAPQASRVDGSQVAPSGGVEQRASAGTDAIAADDPLAIHGSLASRYRGRWSGDATDHDLYETLSLDVGDASKDPVTAHVLGRVAADLDGQTDRDNQFVYPSLADTWSDPVTGLLYEAYIDISAPPRLAALRAGRQVDTQTPVFAHFDGVSLVSKTAETWKLRGGTYGGVPVRLYESSTTGDQIFGLWGEAQPWSGGRVRMDWMHVEDKDRFSANSSDLVGANVSQRLGERARVEANYTRLEQQNRDLRVRGSWNDPARDLTVQLSWYRLLEEQRDYALEFDPYFASLQTFEPFDQIRLHAAKGLGDELRVEGGLDLRRLQDSGDEGSFNRDYDRGWMSLVLLDVGLEGLDVTLTGDTWQSDDQDIETWAVDFSRRLDDGLVLSAGSNYALYRYDVFLDRERDDVRLWYLRARKKLDKSWSLEASYDYQDDDTDQYQVLTLGATWRF
jgi:hypothetical protein